MKVIKTLFKIILEVIKTLFREVLEIVKVIKALFREVLKIVKAIEVFIFIFIIFSLKSFFILNKLYLYFYYLKRNYR